MVIILRQLSLKLPLPSWTCWHFTYLAFTPRLHVTRKLGIGTRKIWDIFFGASRTKQRSEWAWHLVLSFLLSLTSIGVTFGRTHYTR